MRHRVNNQGFGRKPGPKKALVRGLVSSLVEHERIRTTLTKAKYIRPLVEKAITLGQRENSLHARRLLLSKYPNKDTVHRIMTDIAPRFRNRPGGYTRIIKLGPRPGDMADMAYIEFVDYALPPLKDEETVDPEEEKQKTQLMKLLASRKEAHKKSRRQIQSKSRRINR